MSSSKINIIVPNRVQRGKVFLVAVRLDHPMDTGLKRDLMTGKRKPIFFVELLEVFYGGKRVSHMDLTPGISDKPVIKFKLAAGQGGPLRIKIKNNKGQEFEKTVRIKVD